MLSIILLGFFRKTVCLGVFVRVVRIEIQRSKRLSTQVSERRKMILITGESRKKMHVEKFVENCSASEPRFIRCKHIYYIRTNVNVLSARKHFLTSFYVLYDVRLAPSIQHSSLLQHLSSNDETLSCLMCIYTRVPDFIFSISSAANGKLQCKTVYQRSILSISINKCKM